MTRYNDPALTEEYAAGGTPAIYRDMVSLLIEQGGDGPYVDLACGLGVLGGLAQRLLRTSVLGIEGDPKLIALGVLHATPLTITTDDSGLNVLADVLIGFGARELIARRCLPELFGDCPARLPAFADMLASCGITDVYLEGRKQETRSEHPLRNVGLEAEGLYERYRHVTRRGQCLHLRLI